MIVNLHDIPGTHVFEAWVHAHAAATATEKFPIFKAPFACKVTNVAFRPQAAVTGDNTNRTNLNVIDGGLASAGTAEVGNLDLATGTDLTALIDNNVVTTDFNLDAGDYLLVEYEKVSSGVAVGVGYWRVEYEGR